MAGEEKVNPLPEIQFENLFSADPTGQKLWKHFLGAKTFESLKSEYDLMGRNGAVATPHSRQADRVTPQISGHDITYDPAYLELQRLSYGSGIVSRKYDPQFLTTHSSNRHLIAFSIAYYFAQTETGLFCPICMTDALGRVLERCKVEFPEAKETLAHIGAPQLKDLWQGAMFLTEKQGGSDVGANRVQATQKNGRWFLSGEKWFCSNADAKAILVLARMPGDDGQAIPGTKGLGLFLLLRDRPNENFKNWHMKRLKDKLGVRSMASAEIDLDNAEAFLVGGVGEGFKMMTEMVNMSRLYNSVASIAIARRALVEAVEFGKQREAFGQKLTELTLWRSSAADLSAEVFGMQVFIFEAIRQLDLFDGGSEEAGKLLRLMTPMAKGLSGKLAVYACREGMELIGGNAYIEDHIMPRLLRDALVLPIWEGTTNIQSLDLLRALKKEGTDVLMTRFHMALKSGGRSELKDILVKRVADLTQWMGKNAQDEKQAVNTLHQLGRVWTLALLFELSSSSELASFATAAFHRIHSRQDMFMPLATGDVATEAIERELLKI